MRRISVTYILIIILSISIIFIGNKIASNGLATYDTSSDEETVVAKVELILDRNEKKYILAESETAEIIQLVFEAKISKGEQKGETVIASQIIDSMFPFGGTTEVQEGDKILLVQMDMEGKDFQFAQFIRTDELIFMGVVFVVLLLIFGRKKGFNTILSLVLTCYGIFAVFIPAILSGKNIYIWAILICIYTISMTFLIVGGADKKSFAAAVGCFGGIAISGILTIIMSKVLSLTGMVNEESIYLTYVSTETPIDLKAIIFAAIIIGAMGAIMDVSMSISSSLWEVQDKTESSLLFIDLFKSGINIGKDIMGTMANTLILAYIGSSLSVVLLLTAYNTSLMYLFNTEMIVVEILQALVGSFGILMTMPLTSLICSFLYTKTK